MNNEENHEKEEWGGWKIVSDMLDDPNEIGIYPTGECYQKLYEFVVEQKKKATKAERERICDELKENQKGQFEDDAGNICWYLDDIIKKINE